MKVSRFNVGAEISHEAIFDFIKPLKEELEKLCMYKVSISILETPSSNTLYRFKIAIKADGCMVSQYAIMILRGESYMQILNDCCGSLSNKDYKVIVNVGEILTKLYEMVQEFNDN